MPLTPQEELELKQLESLGSSTGLSPSEQKELEQLESLAPAQQIPTSIPVSMELPSPEQVKLPSGNEALKQQSERFNQAFLSGTLAIPSQLLQAQTQFEQQIPVVQQLKQMGITQPTLAESTLSAMPKPLSEALTFEPQNLSETGVQIAAGSFAPEAAVLQPQTALKPPVTALNPSEYVPVLEKMALKPSKVIGQELGKTFDKLEKRRLNLLKLIERANAAERPTEELATKLEDIVTKQTQIKSAIDNIAIPVADRVNIERTFGVRNTPADIYDKALTTSKFVDTLVEKGVIKNNNADGIRQAVFNEVLNANGIFPETKKISKYDILGEIFRWSQVQKRTGVGTGEMAQELVNVKTKAANYRQDQRKILSSLYKQAIDSGVDPKTMLQDLQYFITQPDGSIIFNPKPVPIPGKVMIPETTKRFTMQQENALKNVRVYLDSVADDLKLPKLPGYIPIRELPTLENISTKTSVQANKYPALAQARKSGLFNPAVHETDFANVMQRYVAEASRQKFIGPALEGGVDILNQLKLSGLTNEADAFNRYLADVLNIDSQKTASQLFGTYKTQQIKPLIDQFVRVVPEADTVATEISDAASRAMYNNTVGVNPKTWFNQLLQAPLFGSIELGPTWWASGAKDMAKGILGLGKERMKQAKKILQASLIKDTANLEEQFTKAPKSKIAKAIDFINAPQAWVAKKTMGAGESGNRLQTILGAQNKFEAYWNRGGQQAINSLLNESALTTAQREMVSRAFISGGVENARDVYALLITQRVNFTYSVADKPELLRSTIGKLFPFTTYARNILARNAEAVAEGKPLYLAKQIVYPLSVLAVFDAFTDKSLPSGTLPAESVIDLVSRGITATPFIIAKDPLKTLTPIPKGLIKLTTEDGIELDIDKAIELMYKKADVFPNSSESKYKKFYEFMKGE